MGVTSSSQAPSTQKPRGSHLTVVGCCIYPSAHQVLRRSGALKIQTTTPGRWFVFETMAPSHQTIHSSDARATNLASTRWGIATGTALPPIRKLARSGKRNKDQAAVM